ncbi:MAG: VOC family protein [Kofleriaceae bacterium]
MPTITTFLTFQTQALEAVNHYISAFPNSRITSVNHYGEGAPMPKGTPMVIQFELDGKPFQALNGGSHFKLTDAFSLMVTCDTQAEIDSYTEKLIAGGGEQGPCGWIKDRFGLSWQVDPKILGEMLSDKDPKKVERVMQAMMKMTKIDVAALNRAFEG